MKPFGKIPEKCIPSARIFIESKTHYLEKCVDLFVFPDGSVWAQVADSEADLPQMADR